MFILYRLICSVVILTAFLNIHPIYAQTGTFELSLPKDSDTSSPFKISADIVPVTIGPGRTGTLKVKFLISSGHKIYADTAYVRPDDVFGLEFGTVKAPPFVEKKEPDGNIAKFYENIAIFELPVKITSEAKTGQVQVPLKIGYQGCSATRCFFPEKKNISISFNIDPAINSDAGYDKRSDTANLNKKSLDIVSEKNKKVQNSNLYKQAAAKFGILGVLAAAFIWGFFASLTPCVYPMIPVTVSVIGATNSGTTGRAFTLSLFYVLGMSLTYACFGVAAAWSGSLFGAYTDHMAVRIIVSGIFVILALSMFDIIYISMPSRVSSKLSSYTGKGNIGVFLTGAAAGAVVGPCVGPMLVGLLVYIAGLGNKLQGFLIMWSFALGMGILFLIIGTFSGVAASLPKSGRWMVSIKYFFGILMLGLAIWYLKPVLPENVFYLCTGSFLVGVGIFAGALDPLTHESKAYDRLLKSAGIICLALGIAYAVRFASDSFILSSQNHVNKKQSIDWHLDESQGIALAMKQKKPVIIDFSAKWCSACKQLDNKTFINPEVIALAKDFVSIKIDNTDAHSTMAKKLQKKYKVVGLPTIIFMNSSGKILPHLTITEFVKPEIFVQHMRYAIKSS